MKLEETYKHRIQKLAGIINEDNITLTANKGGRSDANTLSWYTEEYLLKIGSDITSQLDTIIQKEEENKKLLLSKGSTKIIPNTIIIKLIIEGKEKEKELKEEFLITLTVNFENSSNTVASIKYKGIINKFNLNSKHSSEDLKSFETEIIGNIINSIKLISKT
jgi:hypothetical protein